MSRLSSKSSIQNEHGPLEHAARPAAASSVAPVSSGYARALRPCREPASAPHRRVSHSEPTSKRHRRPRVVVGAVVGFLVGAAIAFLLFAVVLDDDHLLGRAGFPIAVAGLIMGWRLAKGSKKRRRRG